MKKSISKTYKIFLESIVLYFKHFKAFVCYMAFPIFGQLAGTLLIFTLCYHFSINLPMLMDKFEFFTNPVVILVCSILLCIPGLFLTVKAFWDYLVAYGSITSIADNMTKSGKVYDIEAHTLLINQRKFSYALLWIIYGLFMLVILNPFLLVVGGLAFVFFSLVFQVYTLEPEKNVFQCFKKSFILVKPKYVETMILLLFLWALTYMVLPIIGKLLFIALGGTGFFANLMQNVTLLYLEAFKVSMPSIIQACELMGIPMNPLDVSAMIVNSTIGWLIVSFLLPLRTVCCYLWYKKLDKAYMDKYKRLAKKGTKTTKTTKSKEKKEEVVVSEDTNTEKDNNV